MAAAVALFIFSGNVHHVQERTTMFENVSRGEGENFRLPKTNSRKLPPYQSLDGAVSIGTEGTTSVTGSASFFEVSFSSLSRSTSSQ